MNFGSCHWPRVNTPLSHVLLVDKFMVNNPNAYGQQISGAQRIVYYNAMCSTEQEVNMTGKHS